MSWDTRLYKAKAVSESTAQNIHSCMWKATPKINLADSILWTQVKAGWEEKMKHFISYPNPIFLPHYRSWKIQVVPCGRRAGWSPDLIPQTGRFHMYTRTWTVRAARETWKKEQFRFFTERTGSLKRWCSLARMHFSQKKNGKIFFSEKEAFVSRKSQPYRWKSVPERRWQDIFIFLWKKEADPG